MFKIVPVYIVHNYNVFMSVPETKNNRVVGVYKSMVDALDVARKYIQDSDDKATEYVRQTNAIFDNEGNAYILSSEYSRPFQIEKNLYEEELEIRRKAISKLTREELKSLGIIDEYDF